jgi:hypothetical protein
VSGLHNEAIVLGADPLVRGERHPYLFAAPALGTALTEEIEGFVGREVPGGLAEFCDPLVHLTKLRLIPGLSREPVRYLGHAREFRI